MKQQGSTLEVIGFTQQGIERQFFRMGSLRSSDYSAPTPSQ